MKTKNITIAAMAAILILGMAAMAVAGQGYGKGRGNGQGPQGAYSQLTPEKQAAVDSIYEKYRPKFTELRNQMLTKHSTLQAMVNGGNADEKKIGKLTSDITSLRDQMRDTRDAMSAELEKETGLVAFNGRGRGNCGGGNCDFGQGRKRSDCPGFGQGRY